MIDAFIPHNSIAIVDRSIAPKNNSIVAVTLDGENFIKHLVKTSEGNFLLPANKKYKAIKLHEEMDVKICDH
jgi:DNA polymerase V